MGYRKGSFKMDLDVEVEVDVDSCFVFVKGVSKSVEVSFNGI